MNGYFVLRGAGKLKEISEAEYNAILRLAAKPSEHELLRQPYYGIQFRGEAYIVLPLVG